MWDNTLFANYGNNDKNQGLKSYKYYPMRRKPISPEVHSLIDYAFGIALMTVPALLTADKKTVLLYCAMAMQILLYGGLTKQPYTLKPIIPLASHRKIDIGNLAGLSLLTGLPGIHKRKGLLGFHIGMTALGLLNVVFTNWKNR
jgi:hypothetical protein